MSSLSKSTNYQGNGKPYPESCEPVQASGSYLILLHIVSPSRIRVGALGEFDFPIGYYAYTGSAMKNLMQRVGRHLRDCKKVHWHIDYLATHPNCTVIGAMVFPSHLQEECKRNQSVQINYPATVVVQKFGSSDCHECESHLMYLGEQLDVDRIGQAAGRNAETIYLLT